MLHISYTVLRLLLTAILLLLPIEIKAQSGDTGRIPFLKRLLIRATSVDTAYITPAKYNFSSMVQASNYLNYYRFSASGDDGNTQTINLITKPRLKLGPYLGWRWAFYGYQFDILRTGTSNKSSGYNISLYSSAFGIDYIREKNSGDFTVSSTSGFPGSKDFRDVHFDGMSTYTSNLNVYYIFNHHRFSYPAAFSQTTQQRRSSGSWKLGFLYSHQKIDYDFTRLAQSLLASDTTGLQMHEGLMKGKINYYDYSVNFGYSYNWVPARNLLAAVSLAPALGYKFSKGQNISHREIFSSRNINFDIVSRIGFVWNTGKIFAGASAIIHAYHYHKPQFSVSNGITVVNIYAGINFLKINDRRKR